MLMYLIESTIPETGETRFYGKNQTFIPADSPHRFVSYYALEHGFQSFYTADMSKEKMPGDTNIMDSTQSNGQ